MLGHCDWENCHNQFSVGNGATLCKAHHTLVVYHDPDADQINTPSLLSFFEDTMGGKHMGEYCYAIKADITDPRAVELAKDATAIVLVIGSAHGMRENVQFALANQPRTLVLNLSGIQNIEAGLADVLRTFRIETHLGQARQRLASFLANRTHTVQANINA